MGSLSSTPSAAPQIPVVNTIAPTSTVTTVVETPEIDSAEQAADARRASLLQRDRSRFGTVLTGFRGLLSQNTNDTQRKTLLGE